MPRVTTLDKSLSVLEAVFRSQEGIGTRSLAALLGLNVATVHNIAQTFRERGYLHQDPKTKQFLPGMRMMLLGHHPSYRHSLVSSASAVMEDVARQLNESILLGAIEHHRIINLKYIPCQHALRVQEPEDVSDHSYCTAFGKVLLAALPTEELDAYLAETELKSFTPRTLDTPEKLRRNLDEVRRLGYARTCDEYCEGISAVAVPIHDPWGGILASIGASAPTIRMQEAQVESTLQVLKQAAASIERLWCKDLTPAPAVSPAGR
jgi:DNA-binding IclR family transcriptional regulator